MTGHHSKSNKNLRTAFFLNLGFTLIEFIGGILVNSVAIMSDAIHDLGDSMSLGFAWYLNKKSDQSADGNFSFGYARFSLLGALINSLVLILGSTYVLFEAVSRLIEPENSNANGMLLLAIMGVAVNGYAMWKLSGGKTLNEKVISWHLYEDVLGWVAVLIVAIVLKFKNIPYLDPILSLLITLYILWGVSKRLKQTLHLFLQGVPVDLNIMDIEKEILNIEKVSQLHLTHVWSMDGENHVFTTHVKLCNIDDVNDIINVKSNIKSVLKKYDFGHYTIETELENETCQIIDLQG